MENKRTYPCIICGNLVVIRSKGKCRSCRQKDYLANSKSPKSKGKSEEIVSFFKFHVEKVAKNPFCEGCGVRVKPNSTVIAHILPKRKTCHPELAGNLDNYMYLCSKINGEPGCHDKYDKLQGNYEVFSMPCWGIAIKRYKKFRHLVNYSKYSAIFEEYLENYTK